MSASPGGAETGAGAAAVRAAASPRTELGSRAESRATTGRNGAMRLFARGPLREMFGGGKKSSGEAPKAKDKGLAAAVASEVQTADTNPAPGEGSKHAPTAPEDVAKLAGVQAEVNALTVAPAMAAPVEAGSEKTTDAVLQQTAGKEQWRPTARASRSKEYKQTMERLKAEAEAKGEDVRDSKVQERMQKQASAEFYNHLAQKTELTAEIEKDPVWREAYSRASAAATEEAQRTGKEVDPKDIGNKALAKYLEVLDRVPLPEKAKRWLKKNWKSLLSLVLALVGGTLFKVTEEGTEPVRKPNGG